MANSKNKCTNCKKYFLEDTMKKSPAGKFHSAECLFEYVDQHSNKLVSKGNKIQKKEDALRKRKFRENDLKIRRKATKTACHEFIRARDSGRPCISCNGPIMGDYHAGHYLESGNNPRIRYDEDNINGQCVHCNTFKGGNSAEYRINLIEKIGQRRVDRIESMKGGTVKMYGDDLKKIENYYKNKLKIL